jgi:hypothetical protein
MRPPRTLLLPSVLAAVRLAGVSAAAVAQIMARPALSMYPPGKPDVRWSRQPRRILTSYCGME